MYDQGWFKDSSRNRIVEIGLGSLLMIPFLPFILLLASVVLVFSSPILFLTLLFDSDFRQGFPKLNLPGLRSGERPLIFAVCALAYVLTAGLILFTVGAVSAKIIYDVPKWSSKTSQAAVKQRGKRITTTKVRTRTKGQITSPRKIKNDKLTEEFAEVVEVIEGDVMVVSLAGGEDTVHLLGIDAPDRNESYFDEAIAKLRELVGRQEVSLVRDVSDRDGQGRLLRYVYVGDVFINAELVRGGYAKADLRPPDIKFGDLFVRLMKEAQGQRVGLWGENVKDEEKHDVVAEGMSDFTLALASAAASGSTSTASESRFSSPEIFAGDSSPSLLSSTPSTSPSLDVSSGLTSISPSASISSPASTLAPSSSPLLAPATDENEESVISPPPERSLPVEPPPLAVPTYQYVCSKINRKFHEMDCDFLPKLGEKIYFYTREEAIQAGYSPCKKCNP